MEPKEIIGVDLDKDLILKAERHLRFQGSLVTPEQEIMTDESLLPFFSNKREMSFDFFPISMPQMYGTIPIVTSDNLKRFRDEKFPYNVNFKHLNILKADSNLLQKFDVILLFSVTKWIHLNNGDSGIVHLFGTVKELLNDGGEVWIEPHSYEAYHNHMWIYERVCEKNKLTLNLVPFDTCDVSTAGKKTFWALLEEMGFTGGKIIKEAEPNGKGFEARPIWKFVKTAN